MTGHTILNKDNYQNYNDEINNILSSKELVAKYYKVKKKKIML